MFQFLHVNSYSRTLSKKAGHQKWVASDVINEAIREASSTPHIPNPEPPQIVFGKPMEDLLDTLDHWAKNTKDATGKRAIRKDAVCLLAGVFSCENTATPEEWMQIRKDSIEYLKEKYGDRLQTVIEHTDEPHPHCHFYVVPRPGDAFESVHQGRAAVKDFVALGGSKLKSNGVYRDAMRAFQDEYFQAVSVKNGMTRIGPGRRRLTREGWKAEKQQAEALKLQISTAEAIKEHAAAEGQALKAEAIEAALATNAQALQDADRLRDEAIANGFAEGLAELEKLPWWKKAGAYLASVVRERDRLIVELDAEKSKNSALKKTVASLTLSLGEMKAKAKSYWEKGKNIQALFKIAKPKAEKTDLLEKQNKSLIDKNAELRDQNQHVYALNEALEEENKTLKQDKDKLEKTLGKERTLHKRAIEELSSDKNRPEI